METKKLVTEEEKAKIQSLFNRKAALDSMVVTLGNQYSDEATQNRLYEKLVNDITAVNVEIRTWWQEISKKYGWTYTQKDSWRLDYETNEITIISTEG